MNAAPFEAFGYADPHGRPELRHALAQYLARARGVRAKPCNIIVCSGAAEGLSLVAGTTINMWDNVAEQVTTAS